MLFANKTTHYAAVCLNGRRETIEAHYKNAVFQVYTREQNFLGIETFDKGQLQTVTDVLVAVPVLTAVCI